MSKKKAPVKSSWVGVCMVCPKDLDGFAGFETQDRKALIAHLKDEHQVVVHKTAQEQMVTHLNCSDSYVHIKQWFLEKEGLERYAL